MLNEIIKTSVYIVSKISSATDLAVKDRICFSKDDNKLYKYSGTQWEVIPTSDIKYADTLAELPNG